MISPTDEYYGKLLEGFGEYTINGFRTKVGESWDRKTTEQRFEIAVESGLSERDSRAVSKSPFSDITPYLREKLEQAELFESFKDKTIEDVNSEFKVDAKPEWYNPNADRNDGSRTPIDEFGTADDDENYSKLTGYIPNPNGIFEGGTVAKEAKSSEGWQEDSQAISRISFDPNLSQEEKNKRISEIEKRMEQEEQKDLDGKGTGYFTEATDFRIRHFLKKIQDAGGKLRFDDRQWGDMINTEDAKVAKDAILLGLVRDENEGNYSTLGNHTFNLVITPEGLGELQDGIYGGIDDSSYRGGYSNTKVSSQKALGSPVYGEANDDIFDGRADHELPNVLSGDVEDISRVGDEDERLKQMHGLGWNVESKSDLDFANQEQSAEGKYEMWESEATEEGNHDGTVWSDFHGKWVDEDVLSKDRKARGFKSETLMNSDANGDGDSNVIRAIDELEDASRYDMHNTIRSRIDRAIEGEWGEFEGGEDISDDEADEIYEFLFDLQQSGQTNMFGAGPYVEREFPHYDKDTVRKYVINWMNNYESIASRMGR